ncbi:MAG: asparagine synthase (glutamine-hydrolyzing) [Candidatus Eremiobacteraeota bacterium]|nr:asparagine synthase (glutamine-hydrolyzing) [Candidatus Eremiobacteraeota bacterium]
MCGIVSFVSPGPVEPERLQQATDSLVTRGPDGCGIWIDPNRRAGLGHRRLAIVDAPAGQQPFVNEDGRVRAVVNGELYDFREQRRRLQALGHVFHTGCDSEVVCHLYEEHGLEFVHQLRGEFAILLWDGDRLVAVRDPFGIKPLCYARREREWWFASKARALWAAGCARQWDADAFWQAASTQYTLPDQTLFQGVGQLPPGHLAVLEQGRLHLRRYWQPEHQEADPAEFLPRLKRAVQERLPEGLPAALQLSGGIDSAAVVALAAAQRSDLRAFTVSFEEASHDEFALAAQVAERCGVPMERVDVSAAELLALLPEAVEASEGLAVNAHLAAKYALDQRIHQAGFKVVLTGEGADEVLLGYPHFRQDLAGSPAERRAIAAGNSIAAGIMVTSGSGLSLAAVQSRLGAIPAFLEAKAALGARIHSCLRPDFAAEYAPVDAYQCMLDFAELPAGDVLEQASELWNRSALANYILQTLGDGCEMAHSLEGRLPFLDGALATWLKGLPRHWKIRQGREKHILREAMREWLPASVVDRQKQPFMAPPLLAGARLPEHLRQLSEMDHPFLDGERVRRQLKREMSGEWAPALTWLATAYHMHERLGL